MNQAMIKLGRLCNRLSGFARGVGRRVAADGSEAFRRHLGGREFVDLHEFQLYLAEVLQVLHGELIALEDRHARDLGREQELRELKSDQTAELRGALSRAQRALGGLLAPEAAARFLRRFRQLPEDPAGLCRSAEGLSATLTDPALELPPLRPGVELDPVAMAAAFEAPARQLAATLPALSDAEAAQRHSRSEKAEAFERLRDFAARVERFYLALYEVTGNARLARRLHKTTRRR